MVICVCGISGFWATNQKDISEQEFVAFIDALKHRGPDGRGVYRDAQSRLWLGHRRLSILDLSEEGAQPMSFASRFWITFNGEIFNFIELKKELEAKGHSFKTASDTEIILASYLEWGEQCQYKFNGIWAFAIWDSLKKELFLSRDRFGVKPLYYFFNGHCFAFASELKAFLALPELKFSFDNQMIEALLRDGNFVEATEETLFQGVKNLQAGRCLVVKKNQLQITTWWNTLEHLPQIPQKYEEQVQQFKELFIDACRIRMRSDVPLGSALSGGLDSSSVHCTLAHIARNGSLEKERSAKNWQKVFVALFPGTSQDEALFAKEVIQHTQTEPFFCTIDTNSLISHLDEALFALEGIFDLPIGPWLLYREFRKQGVVISCDGHGADEYLGGYHHHVESAMADALFPRTNPARFFMMEKMWRGLYPEGSPRTPPSFFRIAKKSLGNALKPWPQIRKLLAAEKKNGWLKNHEAPWRPEFALLQDPAFVRLDALNQLLYTDFHQKTLPAILRNFDRCSMAHGVEIRAPFMDWRLVTFGFALPQNAKIGAGYTKRILRDAMKDILPPSIRTRTSKVGFANPLEEWFSGPLKPFIFDTLHSRSFLQSDIWNGDCIKNDVQNWIHNNDFTRAKQCWQYIQANRLMQLLKT